MYEFISATLTISTDGKYMYGHLWASMGISTMTPAHARLLKKDFKVVLDMLST